MLHAKARSHTSKKIITPEQQKVNAKTFFFRVFKVKAMGCYCFLVVLHCYTTKAGDSNCVFTETKKKFLNIITP